MIPRPCSEETGKTSSKAKTEKFRGVGVLFPGIDLVDDQEDGLTGLSQEAGKFLIRSSNGGAPVNDKEDERRVIDSHLRLFDDLSRDLGFVAGNNASRIHNLKGSPVPRVVP